MQANHCFTPLISRPSDPAGATVGAGRRLRAASPGSWGGGAGELQRGLPQGHPGALPPHHHQQAGAGAHQQVQGGELAPYEVGFGGGGEGYTGMDIFS